jgi:methionyl aminopeptidase
VDEVRKAGAICREIKKEIPKRVTAGAGVLDFAEWLESEIKKKGGSPAFPVNISTNEVAAHFSPAKKCTDFFSEGDMVKVDFGAHVDGWPSDTSITIDLGENGELLAASRDALSSAKEIILSRGSESTLREIGRAIETAIKSRGFQPIVNLTGHNMDRWNLHGGLSVYNFDSGSDRKIGEGLLAVEPFATTGSGRVKNGALSEIYKLVKPKPQRLPNLRALVGEVEKFSTLPFCSRWVSHPELLKMLSRDGTLHNYPLLVEVSGGMVSQTEDTFLVGENKAEVTT